jgi:hypothetical protein
MHDERLDTLLQLLKQTEVQPPLASDSRIKAMITNHRMYRIGLPFIALLLVATGTAYFVGPTNPPIENKQPHPSRPANNSGGTIPQQVSVTDETEDPTGASADDSVREESALDPRSILTLSLTDEELRLFGIRRYDDSISVLIQTLVVADTLRSRALGLTSEQLRDTTLLFHYRHSCSDGSGRPQTFSAHRLSGYQLDELSPVFVQVIADTNVPLVEYYNPPALIPVSLFDSIMFAAALVEPAPSKHPAPEMSFLASIPDKRFFGFYSKLPSSKPILLSIPDKRNAHRYIVALMPTGAVLEKLPQRFRGALKTCYAPYVPGTAMPSRILKPKQHVEQTASATKTKLVKVAVVSGHPFVELDDASLHQFGFFTDDVSICQNGWSVATIDTVTTSFVRSSSRRPVNEYLTNLGYESSIAMQRTKGFDLPVGSLGRLVPDAGSSLEIQLSGQKDTSIRCYTSHVLQTLPIDSIPPADWLDRYPLARKFASEVATEINSESIPTDSLGYYSVQHGNHLIPVLKLLLGLRVATPWVSRPGWNGEKRRLVSISWFLPSQSVMNALPDNMRQFLQPEYEALYASIEQSQSITEACNLLNCPSALGFCSIGDSTLRIDGVGPIPARHGLTLYVTSDRDVPGTIQIVDGNGSVLQEKSNILIRQGANQVPLPIESTMPSGSYMVILSTPSEVRRSRVLISK